MADRQNVRSRVTEKREKNFVTRDQNSLKIRACRAKFAISLILEHNFAILGEIGNL